MGIKPRLGVELSQSLRAKGVGLNKVAGLLRLIFGVTVLLCALTLAGNNWEQLQNAPLFIVAGGILNGILWLILVIGTGCFYLVIGNDEPAQLAKSLHFFGSGEMKVYLSFLVLAFLLVRFFNKVVERSYINSKVKIGFIILLVLVDVRLFDSGGKEAIRYLILNVVKFLKTF